MRATGETLAAIGQALGLSRSAVAGRCARLGLLYPKPAFPVKRFATHTAGKRTVRGKRSNRVRPECRADGEGDESPLNREMGTSEFEVRATAANPYWFARKSTGLVDPPPMVEEKYRGSDIKGLAGAEIDAQRRRVDRIWAQRIADANGPKERAAVLEEERTLRRADARRAPIRLRSQRESAI